jgi:hypothetical protein
MAEGTGGKAFIKRHSRAVAAFGVACVSAFVGAVYVFVWFANHAESTKLVPGALSLWTMGNLVTFLINAVLWEIVLVGIPVGIAFAIGWRWWRSLPEDERREYGFLRGGSRSTGGGGGGSLLFFIAFCIKVYLDGNWNSPIASWTLDYMVASAVLILEWFVVIFGIPFAIVALWWIRRER